MKKLLMLLLATLLEAGQDSLLTSYQADYTLSYENIDLKAGEQMGLMGIGMHFDISRYSYGGAMLYGAVDGKRGGFFTVGADGGLKTNLSKNLQMRSGLFIGAGGGGSAPQGGGLMLRPYTELRWQSPDFSVGAGISHIYFPNGEIESTQGYLSLQIPTGGAYLKGHPALLPQADNTSSHSTGQNRLQLSMFAQHYKPDSSSRNTDGTPTQPFTLAGIKLEKALNHQLYSYFQAAGAGDGESDGYMEVFGGLGYRYQIADLPLYLGAEAAVGASGGGRVDTEGGLVYRAQGTLQADLGKHVSLTGFAGRIESLHGSFGAQSYGGTLTYRSTFFDILPNDPTVQTDTSAWRVRMLNKSYLNGKALFKDDRDVSRVDLLGFAIDRYLGEYLYLTGQTYWAYRGRAGGYAEGIFGLGYQSSRYGDFSCYGEMLAGVGGGGGIDIGGGLWGSIGGGITYAIDESWEFSLGADYMRNKADSFSTTDVTFGISYRFSLLEER